VSIALGAAIGGALLMMVNSLSGVAVFGSLALSSWFKVLRIQRREFFPGIEFLRHDALRCLNVLAW
jgi:hypothetical protein